jgi:hypothetical protein
MEAVRDRLDDGEEIKAAGVFGLQDNYLAIAGAGVAGSVALPAGNPALETVETVGALEGPRQANAAKQGVSVRMGVVVTDRQIHVLRMSALGSELKEELFSFERASTDVEIKKFGLSRRVHLRDRGSDRKLELIGTTARFARQSKGDKAVLAELEGHA